MGKKSYEKRILMIWSRLIHGKTELIKYLSTRKKFTITTLLYFSQVHIKIYFKMFNVCHFFII